MSGKSKPAELEVRELASDMVSRLIDMGKVTLPDRVSNALYQQALDKAAEKLQECVMWTNKAAEARKYEHAQGNGC